MIQRTGDSITTGAFVGGGIALRFWEARGYNYGVSEGRITGSQLILDASKSDFGAKYPLVLDLTIVGKPVSGSFTMKRSEAYRRKRNYSENPVLEDFSGDATGTVLTEEDLRQRNAISLDAGVRLAFEIARKPYSFIGLCSTGFLRIPEQTVIL